MDRGAWRAIGHMVAKSRTQLYTWYAHTRIINLQVILLDQMRRRERG